MAYTIKNGHIGMQQIADVSTTQNHPLGFQVEGFDPDYGSATFLYVKGVSSGRTGAWVTYSPDDWTTALLAANAIGPVGVMMSTLDAATDFGWIMVVGNPVSEATTVSGAITDGADLYIDGTAGDVDALVITGDRIWGAKAAGINTTLGKVDAEIVWPFVTNAVESGTS